MCMCAANKEQLLFASICQSFIPETHGRCCICNSDAACAQLHQLRSNTCFYLQIINMLLFFHIDLVSIWIVCHQNDSCFISHLILNSFPAPTWKIQKHKCQKLLMLNVHSEQKCCRIHQITSLSQPRAALSDRK